MQFASVTDCIPQNIMTHLKTNVRSLYCMMDRCHNELHFDETTNIMLKILTSMRYSSKSLDMESRCELMIAVAYHDTGRLLCPNNQPRHHSVASCVIYENDLTLQHIIRSSGLSINANTICDLIHKDYRPVKSKEELKRMVKDADNCSLLVTERALSRLFYYYADIKKMNNYQEIREAMNQFILGKDWGFKPQSEAFQTYYAKQVRIISQEDIDSVVQKMEKNHTIQ